MSHSSNEESTAPHGADGGNLWGGDDDRPAALETGQILNGYELQESIGVGGMATVFRARQISLDRTVALKFMRADVAASNQAAFSERFDREARLLGKLNHPNIVSVFDRGSWRGIFYIVMEFVEGQTLLQLCRERQLGPAQLIYLIGNVGRGIEYMHGHGIIHRDIKPSNILITQRGAVKVADFGLANIVAGNGGERQGDDANRLTAANMAMGTLNFMAPEQAISAADVDQRADVYSLAVTFYFAMTAKVPAGDFKPVSQLRPKFPPAIDKAIEKGMARRPSERFQSASELCQALQAALKPAGYDLTATLEGYAEGSKPFYDMRDPLLDASSDEVDATLIDDGSGGNGAEKNPGGRTGALHRRGSV
jgi:serine/threonine protein kinase